MCFEGPSWTSSCDSCINKGHTLYQSRRARYVALRGRLGRHRVVVVFTPTNTTSGYHH